MEMVCQGPGCAVVFTAKRGTAKFHSKACSMRASRIGQLGTPTPADQDKPGRPKRKPVLTRTTLEKFTRKALAEVDRLDTWSGQAALALAQRIDAGGAETGSALASMVREHAAAMDRALDKDAPDDPVAARAARVAAGEAEDELARRRGRDASES